MQIKDVMCKEIVSVAPNVSVKEAAIKMRESKCGTVAVLKDDQLVGLLNDRQITINVVASDRNPSRVQVGDIMTKKLVTSSPDMDIIQAAKIMGKLHYRRLPVVDRQHHLQGIVSISDLSRPLKQYIDGILDELSKREPSSPIRFEEPDFMPQWMFT
jgi:CBS domain-containing protein